MNRTKLKNYAPLARQEFIQAITDRAAFYGLSPEKIEPITETGDVAIIAGGAFPKAIVAKRKTLEDRIGRDGFEQTMEALAYTWFNRLVAIRYMELHGYLEHGYRVLSNSDPAKNSPEILEHAEHVELPGLKRETVIDLKLAGNKEAELYRMLLVAQCNALHAAMPFLFERIDDETELILPESLLHTDSLVRKLVSDIDEEDWQQVEIIGWLYQFYISQKKSEVMGKVVKSEDIPAATQLFTPNWIVKYLVQNSLGRQWVATYPNSSSKQQMELYIEPAEQTPEVHSKLAKVTPASLNPEELTLLDPACGSGHILVEAYDLFKAIYQERGYRAKDIPRLILENNLYGLEIDDRAAQLAAFSLMMKARADDRGIFATGVQPDVLAIQESKGLDAKEITEALNQPILKEDGPPSGELFEEIADEKSPLFSKEAIGVRGGVAQADVAHIIELFQVGKTLGSLIQVPESLAKKLTAIAQRVQEVIAHGGMFESITARSLQPLISQSKVLAGKYDAVVMNPPYMGGRNGMNPTLKGFVESIFEAGKADLFGAFIEQGLFFTKPHGFLAMITMEAWMFLPSFKDLRPQLLDSCATWSMLHLGPRAFDTISGEIVRTTAFAFQNISLPDVNGTYRRLVKGTSEAEKQRMLHDNNTLYYFRTSNFPRVPESRWAYWLTDAVLACFDAGADLESAAPVRQGFQTGDNDYFMRWWHEVDFTRVMLHASSKEDVFDAGKKWVPYNKGGEFRKWYGNNEYLVAFDQQHYEMLLVSGNCLPSRHLYFRESVTWSAMGGVFGARLSPKGFTFSAKGACAFPTTRSAQFVLALLNSRVSAAMFEFLAPTLDFNVGSIRQIPLVQMPSDTCDRLERFAAELVGIAKNDWDWQEESWDFQQSPLLENGAKAELLGDSCAHLSDQRALAIETAARLEADINVLLLAAYGLDSEMTADVTEDEITLARSNTPDEVRRVISYAIGCMMGRFSLDKPGLIYADSGNKGFDAKQYNTFRADDDAIIPLLDTDWGIRDDATNRAVEFIGLVWPKQHLEQNLKFIADTLGPTGNEQPRETIRRYFANGFYRHHLSTYKKRPIYWLFSSGKQRAFQCLVYLHRYHEGTLARMRTEYVIKIQGQITARIDELAGELEIPSPTSHRKKMEKERDALLKQQAELQAFDEKLRHYADRRITLDLDEGVKCNYAKFGDLLAEAKAVTGGNADD